MSADRIAHLLSAASTAPDRSMKLAYSAEARNLIAREIERLAQQQLLLAALETELGRTVGDPGGSL
jgi:hypothetical protein